MCSGWHHEWSLSLDLPHLSGACLPSLADLPEQLHATVFRLREVEKQCMSIPTTIQRLMGPERHLNVTRFKLMISGKCYVNNLTCHVYLYYMKLSCMPLISYLTHIIRPGWLAGLGAASSSQPACQPSQPGQFPGQPASRPSPARNFPKKKKKKNS